MIINRSFKEFRFRHRNKENQIVYTSKTVKNDDEVLNLIDSFLNEKNSFIFESVEKGKIKGRYTIFGKNPDKIWEFNNNNSYIVLKNKKIKLKEKPENLIEKIIEDFKFKTPKKLPKICSLISGYFSYDSIRYIEKIPNNCQNDLLLPDVRLLRPRTLVIHDNVKKKIFYICNIFKDEKITNYENKFNEIKSDLFKLLIQSSIKNLNKPVKKKLNNIKVKSNTSKSKFLNMVNKAKKYIKIGDIFQDEKITNYKNKFNEIKSDLFKLLIQSSIKNLNKPLKEKLNNIKVKSNTSKSKFLNMVKKAKKYIKIGDIFQVVLSQRFEAKLTKKPIDIYKFTFRSVGFNFDIIYFFFERFI